jgi:hypothetical protein
MIGYGGMLMESFVAIMAMVAAAALQPGVYFAINSPAGVVGADPAVATATITAWGFPVTPEEMATLAADMLKAWVPVWAAARLLDVPAAPAAAAVAAVLGHAYPLYTRFRGGGKGVATTAGGFLYIAPGAVLLATAGVFFASAAPDGLEQLGEQAGIASRARNLIQSPFADYGAAFGGSGWAGKAAAGVAGLAIVSAACVLIGRAAARKGTR